VQVKRYDPQSRPIGREVVALFQRDAQTKGAERAILVTLGKFSEPAGKAASVATPTVDLIDGERLAVLVLDREVGVRREPLSTRAGSTGSAECRLTSYGTSVDVISTGALLER
jgi:restriction system protein